MIWIMSLAVVAIERRAEVESCNIRRSFVIPAEARIVRLRVQLVKEVESPSRSAYSGPKPNITASPPAFASPSRGRLRRDEEQQEANERSVRIAQVRTRLGCQPGGNA